MKKLLAALTVLTFIFAVFPAVEAPAFLPKVDPVKSPSRISLWFGEIKANCEKAMEYVSNSKLGKLYGEGVKSTKEGVNFAKDIYKQGMDIYNQGMEYVDEAKNSKEYKAAQLGKKIAAEGKKLQKLEEQKLMIEENADQELELLKTATNQKLAALKSNLSTLENSTDTSDDTQLTSAMEEVKRDSNKAIEQLQIDFRKKSKDIEDNAADAIAELDEQKTAINAKIAELTKQLAELSGAEFNIENPLEALQNAKEEIFLKPDQKETVSNIKNLREKRFEERRRVIYEVYEKALRGKLSLTALEEDVKLIADLAETMPDESGNSGVNVEVLIRQADILEKYIEYVLADLALETTVAVAGLRSYTPVSPDKLADFKLCNYTKSQKEINEEKLAALKKKVTSVDSKIKDTVNKAREGAELAKGIGEVVESGKEVITGNPAVVGGMF